MSDFVLIETDEDADWLIAVQLLKEQTVPGYVADRNLPRPAPAAPPTPAPATPAPIGPAAPAATKKTVKVRLP